MKKESEIKLNTRLVNDILPSLCSDSKDYKMGFLTYAHIDD